MPKGKIEFVVIPKAYGAILSSSGLRSFHFADMEGLTPNDLKKGLEVLFDEEGADRARRVRRHVECPDMVIPRNLNETDPAFQIATVPKTMKPLLEKAIDGGQAHAGLILDRFLAPVPRQEQQQSRLEEVITYYRNSQSQWEQLRVLDRAPARLLAQRHGVLWPRVTSTPLTLHLARASMLENAGICLHQIHGFPYLPGTGLKGMARAYAETVWVPTQENAAEAWQIVEHIFGWTPESDRTRKPNTDSDGEKGWKPRFAEKLTRPTTVPGRPPATSHAGSIIFHDAWPTQWPQLFVDIVNNHHPKYYQEGQAPGDWDDPVPVYFLAMQPGASFSFALARRRDDVDESLLQFAREWLDGALTHFGFGGKTAAGYGYFSRESLPQETADAVRNTWDSLQQVDPENTPHAITRREFTTTLELVTPAFLAGADQGSDDCTLRAATLRGQLRWWWRTLHAGFLDVENLRKLESMLWGDTQQGGLIQLALTPAPRNPKPELFNLRDPNKKQSLNSAFLSKHSLCKPSKPKTTQGLFYASYGMDEKSMGKPRPRYFSPSGSNWTVRLIARRLSTLPDGVTVQDLLDQGLAALSLLVHFGAVGSKSRKGFGSLLCQDVDISRLTVSQCREIAKHIRGVMRLNTEFDRNLVQSSALEMAIGLDDEPVLVPWGSPWKVLDEIGYAYQSFASNYNHNPEKRALGLPRKIHGPRVDGPLKNQVKSEWKSPIWLGLNAGKDDRDGNANLRHSSPVHIHVHRMQDGAHSIRVVAFPAPNLPDLDASHFHLENFIREFQNHLTKSIRSYGSRPSHHRPGIQQGQAPVDSPRTSARPQKRQSGEPVRVTFLGEQEGKNGKNAFWVQEEGKKSGRLVLDDPPSPLPEVNSTITVYIHDDTPSNLQYRWTPPPPKSTAPTHGRSGPKGSRPRR